MVGSLLQDQVCIGPSEPEGADSRETRSAAVGPDISLALDPDGEFIERDVGIRLREMQARGNLPVVECQCSLDQPGDPGRGFEVADVGLDRAQGTASVEVAALGKHGTQSGQLDRIAQQGPGSMGLDVIDLPGGDAGVPVGRAEDGFLGQSAGGGQTVGAPVLVDRTTSDHGIDRVAVGQGTRERLEYHHPRALAADITIGLRVERLAPAVRGQEPSLGKAREHFRQRESSSRRPPSRDRIRRPRGSGRPDGPPPSRTSRPCRC